MSKETYHPGDVTTIAGYYDDFFFYYLYNNQNGFWIILKVSSDDITFIADYDNLHDNDEKLIVR